MIEGIIRDLEKQKLAILNALAALASVGGVPAPAPVTPASTASVETTGRRGKKRSAAVRRKMALAQKVRWARIHGEAATPAPVTKEAPKPKRQISPEGIKRIIAATKKRWRLKRAADQAALEQAEAKKAARKKSAPAKKVKKAAPGKKTAAVKTADNEVPF